MTKKEHKEFQARMTYMIWSPLTFNFNMWWHRQPLSETTREDYSKALDAYLKIELKLKIGFVFLVGLLFYFAAVYRTGNWF